MRYLFPTGKGYQRKWLGQDVLSGVVIAAVSIPISMGYAQIAGLPAVYGLYGSLLPVILFALLSTSPQFIFGVDAAPAAMIGGVLGGMGIAMGSAEAERVVPVLTFYVGIWLLLFALLRAGRVLRFVSTSVMGGFISGICCTIILMQLPKLMGGTAGTGELPELVRHLVRVQVHPLSLGLGAAALVILLAALCTVHLTTERTPPENVVSPAVHLGMVVPREALEKLKAAETAALAAPQTAEPTADVTAEPAEEESLPATDTSVLAAAVTTDALYIRRSGDWDAEALTLVGYGTTVAVTGKSGGWYQVRYDGIEGYLSGDYLDLRTSGLTGYGQVTADALNLRSGAGTGYETVAPIYGQF